MTRKLKLKNKSKKCTRKSSNCTKAKSSYLMVKKSLCELHFKSLYNLFLLFDFYTNSWL